MPRLTKREKLLLAAGIMEGEGSFYIADAIDKRKGRNGWRSIYPGVMLRMTDEEPVAFVAEVLDMARCGPYQPQMETGGTKCYWAGEPNRK